MKPSEGLTNTIFFSRTYDEAIALLYEARDYFAYAASGELMPPPASSAACRSRPR